MHAIPIPDFDPDRAARGCLILATFLAAVLFLIGVAVGSVLR
jgi:hypothetical protein